MDRKLKREAKAQKRSRHHAAAHRAQHQLPSAVQVHFLHNPPAMGFHRVQAQVETVGDIVVAIAFRQKFSRIESADAVARTRARRKSPSLAAEPPIRALRVMHASLRTTSSAGLWWAGRTLLAVSLGRLAGAREM